MRLGFDPLSTRPSLLDFLSRNPRVSQTLGESEAVESAVLNAAPPLFSPLAPEPTGGLTLGSRGDRVRDPEEATSSPAAQRLILATEQKGKLFESALATADYLVRHPELIENQTLQIAINSAPRKTVDLGVPSDDPVATTLALSNLGGFRDLVRAGFEPDAVALDSVLTEVKGAIASEAASYFAFTPDSPLTEAVFQEKPFAALRLLEDPDRIRALSQSLDAQQRYAGELDREEASSRAGAVARVRAAVADSTYFSDAHYYAGYYEEPSEGRESFSVEDDLTRAHAELDPLTELLDLSSRFPLRNSALDIRKEFLNPASTLGGVRTVSIAEITDKGVTSNAEFSLKTLSVSVAAESFVTARALVESPAFRDALDNSAKAEQLLGTDRTPRSSTRSLREAIQRYAEGLARREPS